MLTLDEKLEFNNLKLMLSDGFIIDKMGKTVQRNMILKYRELLDKYIKIYELPNSTVNDSL